mgnify:CR=1 FL=1
MVMEPAIFNVPVAVLSNVPAPASDVVTATIVVLVNVTQAATVNVPVALKFSVELNPLVLFMLIELNPNVATVEPLMDVPAAGVGVLKFNVEAVVNEYGVPADVLTIKLP